MRRFPPKENLFLGTQARASPSPRRPGPATGNARTGSGVARRTPLRSVLAALITASVAWAIGFSGDPRATSSPAEAAAVPCQAVPALDASRPDLSAVVSFPSSHDRGQQDAFDDYDDDDEDDEGDPLACSLVSPSPLDWLFARQAVGRRSGAEGTSPLFLILQRFRC